MDVGGARADRVDPSDCINPSVPVSVRCDAAESAPPLPHRHPALRAGGISPDAGLRGGGGDRTEAAQDRWADRGPVLVGGVASHGAPLVGQIGTHAPARDAVCDPKLGFRSADSGSDWQQWHSAHLAGMPKSAILHAPRLIRTADLLIRSPAPNPHVRAVSRTSGAARPGRAHENQPKMDQIGTTLAQPQRASNLFLARTGSMHAAG